MFTYMYGNTRNMPQNCCIPGCTKKVYEEDGVKISLSFHKLPENKELFREWIVAIWKDIGKEFRMIDHTRVFSRHFKSSDYLASLAGCKKPLKLTAGLSVFFWKQGSQCKRSPRRKEVLLSEKLWQRDRKQVPKTWQMQMSVPHANLSQQVIQRRLSGTAAILE